MRKKVGKKAKRRTFWTSRFESKTGAEIPTTIRTNDHNNHYGRNGDHSRLALKRTTPFSDWTTAHFKSIV